MSNAVYRQRRTFNKVYDTHAFIALVQFRMFVWLKCLQLPLNGPRSMRCLLIFFGHYHWWHDWHPPRFLPDTDLADEQLMMMMTTTRMTMVKIQSL